jgi:hypothetical protein
MDELLLVAFPVALVAGVAAFVKPARRRLMPVAKAAGRAGVAVVGAGVAGTLGIVDAAIHGEGKPAPAPSEDAPRAPATTRSSGAGRTRAKATSGRTRRRPPASAKS